MCSIEVFAAVMSDSYFWGSEVGKASQIFHVLFVDWMRECGNFYRY